MKMKMYFPTVAEYEQLKADTAEDRNIVNYAFPGQILDRIEKLIKYYELNHTEKVLIYSACFHIGYTDGIRAERARRKKQNKHTGKELCNV